MVCPYCGSKTKVSNSRYKKNSRRTWRRRTCVSCNATITTYEIPDWSSVLLVQSKEGSLTPFFAQRHIASLLKALSDSRDNEEVAYHLHTTIMAQLLTVQEGASVHSKTIADITAQALDNYDYNAYLRYIADHPQVSLRPKNSFK